MSERDLDAEFERIIAGWDEEAPDPQLRSDAVSPADETGAPDPMAAELGDAGAARPEALGALGEGDLGADALGSGPLGSDTLGPAVADSDALGAAAAGGDTVAAEAGAQDPAPPDAASPTSPPGQSSGALGVPIAPTTSHVWRGNGPQRDDVDALLDAVEPDDEHFVPPSEIDLPSAETDPMYWAIVVGLVGGPLLLLYLLLFDRDGSGWWIVTGLAMLITGFVLLVLRGGTERDPFDDGTRI